jgi:hypothetical protein
MLLPATWLQGDKRSRWLETTALARVLFITPRPSMPPGAAVMAGQKPGNASPVVAETASRRGTAHYQSASRHARQRPTVWLGILDSNSQMSLYPGAVCIGLFPPSAKSLWYENAL